MFEGVWAVAVAMAEGVWLVVVVSAEVEDQMNLEIM